jgi:hypothetical protein
MTVIKRYNTGTAAWETVVVGRSGEWDGDQTINVQTDSYTLLTGDAGDLVTVDKSTATTITVDTALALQPGQRIDLLRKGTGAVTVQASGVTVNGTPGLKLRSQWSVASLVCLAAGEYVLVGDLLA